MQSPTHHVARNAPQAVRLCFRTGLCAPVIAMAVLISGFAVTCRLYSQQPANQGQQPIENRPIINPIANRPPDANAQMLMRDQQAKKANYDAANSERKRQISDDSARLLKLASDLKSEVDKTSKDTLLLGVIRKAEEIEKLAHSVKEKMKLTMNGN